MFWYNTALTGGSGGSSDLALCEFTMIPDTYIERDGSQVSWCGWSSTDYLDISGATKLYRYGYIGSASWNAFYNANKGYVSGLSSGGITNVPSNAKYVRFSAETSSITSSSNHLVAYYGT